MAILQTAPPPFPNEDRRSIVEAVIWTEASVAILIVGLRFYARVSFKALGADDLLMLLALVGANPLSQKAYSPINIWHRPSS